MQWAIPIPKTEHEATVAPWVFGIVLDSLPLCDHPAHFCGAYHPVRPEHLSQSVREKEHLSVRRCTDPIDDVAHLSHVEIVSDWTRFFKMWLVVQRGGAGADARALPARAQRRARVAARADRCSGWSGIAPPTPAARSHATRSARNTFSRD